MSNHSYRAVHYKNQFDLDCEVINTKSIVLQSGGSGISGINLGDLGDIANANTGNLLIGNGSEYEVLPVGSTLQFLGVMGGRPTWLNINDFRANAQMLIAANFSTPYTLVISAINVWTPLTAVTSANLLNISESAGALTVTLPGFYLCTGTISFRVPTGTQRIQYGIGINGANPTSTSILGADDVASANSYTSTNTCFSVSLNAGDTVQYYMENKTSGNNIDIGAFQFNLVKVSN